MCVGKLDWLVERDRALFGGGSAHAWLSVLSGLSPPSEQISSVSYAIPSSTKLSQPTLLQRINSGFCWFKPARCY